VSSAIGDGSAPRSGAFTGLLEHAIAVSMDGRGAWRDNVFVERLWRSVKHEEVYLRAYDSVGEAHGRLCLVTSPSTIQSGRIQVLTRGRQSVFTMTICRRLREHKFSPPLQIQNEPTGRGST
jgi:putative transposase